MVISFARRQNVKMIPLDVVSGGFDMVCNGGRVVIFNEGLEVFSFPIMKSSFCFAYVMISTSVKQNDDFMIEKLNT